MNILTSKEQRAKLLKPVFLHYNTRKDKKRERFR